MEKQTHVNANEYIHKCKKNEYRKSTNEYMNKYSNQKMNT